MFGKWFERKIARVKFIGKIINLIEIKLIEYMEMNDWEMNKYIFLNKF